MTDATATPRLARDHPPRAAELHGASRLRLVVTLLALLFTTPAFYAELLSSGPPHWATSAYLLAGAVLSVGLWSGWKRLPRQTRLLPRLLDAALVLGMIASALAPPSSVSKLALALRLAVAFLTLIVMVWRLQRWVTRGGAVYIMMVALAVLLLCGAGYWWLEPNTPTLADGLWLAFTTAATVGFGDVVPSTPASRIFSVFVVLLGYGVLSLATAAIATSWIETEERRIEREILRDLHQRLGSLHEEIAELRSELRDRAKSPSS